MAGCQQEEVSSHLRCDRKSFERRILPLACIAAPFGIGKSTVLRMACKVRQQHGVATLVAFPTNAALEGFCLESTGQLKFQAFAGDEDVQERLASLSSPGACLKLCSIDSAFRVPGPVTELLIDEGAKTQASQVLSVLGSHSRIPRLILVGDAVQMEPFQLSRRVHFSLILKSAQAALQAAGAPTVQLTLQHRVPVKRAVALGRRCYGRPLDTGRGEDMDDHVHWRELKSKEQRKGSSMVNEEEADWAVRQAKKILNSKTGRAVTVLAFYEAQASLVREKMTGLDVAVHTVDASQGATVDTAIVLTTNLKLTPFLMDSRRSLVAS